MIKHGFFIISNYSEAKLKKYPLKQGVKLIFFSDSHLASKFFKVVANSKKVGRHFQRQKNLSLRCQRSR